MRVSQPKFGTAAQSTLKLRVKGEDEALSAEWLLSGKIQIPDIVFNTLTLDDN